jgi:hypothetical protein
MASLGMSCKSRVKTTFYMGGSTRTRGARATWLSRIYRGGRRGVMMVPGVIILATSTPGVTPRILQLNFFFSLLAKIRALPFLFLFALATP